MKRIGKMLFSAVMMLVMLAVWIAHVHWNTIEGLYFGVKYSNEELAEMDAENKEKLNQWVVESGLEVRDLTDEEKTALNDGKIDDDQAIQISSGQSTLDKELEKNENKPADKPEEDKPPQDKPDEKPAQSKPAMSPQEVDKKLSELIAALYVHKNNFLNKLAGLEDTIANEFYSQPKDQWNGTNKARIISKYMGQLAEWEKECDALVYGILEEIKTVLKDAGRTDDITSKIEENYLTEKRLKKAEYIEISNRKSRNNP